MTSIQAHNLFKINQKLFYESLKCKQKDNDAPNPTFEIEFWSNITSGLKKWAIMKMQPG